MISISKFMHRLRNVTYLIENPRLIGVYQRGGIVPISHMLDHSWLREFDIATVLDIGANTGQFAVTINTIIPEAKVYSFEPLPDCFIELKARMANVKNFTALNLGIGEDKGELEFERNSFFCFIFFSKND
ncbi:MAG: FkbM family methyltransferase [Richelia sp. RM2_1_2]|nr:FkbM family methyltransferase [Richelia sp. RM2_1_2]